MVDQPTVDVTITLTTEGGTQVFNETIPEAGSVCDFTLIAQITIPGGACHAGSGTNPFPCNDDLALSEDWW